jgi:hypothetical protein
MEKKRNVDLMEASYVERGNELYKTEGKKHADNLFE